MKAIKIFVLLLISYQSFGQILPNGAPTRWYNAGSTNAISSFNSGNNLVWENTSGTKQITWSWASLNGTARTFTMPNATGTMALQEWVTSQSYLTTETDASALKINSNLSDLNNPATARTNLGASTLGSNLFGITNNNTSSKWIRISAANSPDLRTAAETLSDIGAAASVHTHAISDVTNLQSSLDAKASIAASYSAQSGSYTLANSDNGKVIDVTSASAVTITVPSGLPTGFNCVIRQLGAGQVTIAASGTTINNRQSHTKTAGQYAAVTVLQISGNTYTTGGDTSN